MRCLFTSTRAALSSSRIAPIAQEYPQVNNMEREETNSRMVPIPNDDPNLYSQRINRSIIDQITGDDQSPTPNIRQGNDLERVENDNPTANFTLSLVDQLFDALPNTPLSGGAPNLQSQLGTQVIASGSFSSTEEGTLYQEFFDIEQTRKKEEVMMVDGKMHGLYRSWCLSGSRNVECTYKHGKKDGIYKRWVDDVLVEEIPYVDGKKEGVFRYSPSSLYFRETTYVQDIKNGPEIHSDGKIRHEWTYKDGKLNGIYIFSDLTNGKVLARCNYIDDKKDGENMEIEQYGKDIEVHIDSNYSMGKMHGPHRQKIISYGKVIQTNYCEYDNNKIQGIYREVDGNGYATKQCVYHNGVLDGQCREWYTSTMDRLEYDFIHGDIDELPNPYDNDEEFGIKPADYVLRRECFYEDGELQGVCAEYFPNGKLYTSRTYSKGKLDGAVKAWRIDGSLRLEGVYLYGKPIGFFYLYSKEGIKTTYRVVHGKKILIPS